MMTLKDILQIVRSPGRKQLAYIAVGLMNTVIVYVIGVVCFYLLLDWLPKTIVGLVATMIGVFQFCSLQASGFHNKGKLAR